MVNIQQISTATENGEENEYAEDVEGKWYRVTVETNPADLSIKSVLIPVDQPKMVVPQTLSQIELDEYSTLEVIENIHSNNTTHVEPFLKKTNTVQTYNDDFFSKYGLNKNTVLKEFLVNNPNDKDPNATSIINDNDPNATPIINVLYQDGKFIFAEEGGVVISQYSDKKTEILAKIFTLEVKHEYHVNDLKFMEFINDLEFVARQNKDLVNENELVIDGFNTVPENFFYVPQKSRAVNLVMDDGFSVSGKKFNEGDSPTRFVNTILVNNRPFHFIKQRVESIKFIDESSVVDITFTNEPVKMKITVPDTYVSYIQKAEQSLKNKEYSIPDPSTLPTVHQRVIKLTFHSHDPVHDDNNNVLPSERIVTVAYYPGKSHYTFTHLPDEHKTFIFLNGTLASTVSNVIPKFDIDKVYQERATISHADDDHNRITSIHL